MGVYIDGISKQTVEALLVQYPYYLDKLIEIELVRCGDCKWCEKSGGILWCNIWHDDTNGLNFCSYAERRADGDI